MAAIDHLVYVSADLDEGIGVVERLTGIRPAIGGVHPGRGTRNALAGFDRSSYLEIIGVDHGQPDPAEPRPFGVAPGVPPHLDTFAVHPTGDESLEDVLATLGRTGVGFGPIVPMTRMRPDGVELSWRLAFPLGGSGVVPFAIDWGATPNPATTLPSIGTLRRLVVTHPDATIRDVVGGLDRRIEVDDGPPASTATLSTPNGEVALRSPG